MRQRLTLFALLFSGLIFSQSGIHESYLILDNGTGPIYYDLQANTTNPDFVNQNLGTFTNGASLSIRGFENITDKCNTDDITTGNLYYRVYLDGSVAPAFNVIVWDSVTDLGDNPNCEPTVIGGADLRQRWENTNTNIEIINGLPSGLYNFEVYSTADFTFDTGSGTHAAPATGFYQAQFSIDNPPIAICQNITIVLDATGNTNISANDIDGGSSDDLGTISLSTNIDTFNCSNLGPNTVILTVTDAIGQTATCEATVTVVDDLAPVPDLANLPEITAQCEVISLVSPMAIDNCGGTVTITNDAIFPISTQGTNVVTWTYEDENGNISIQTQNVRIQDTTAPVISLTGAAAITLEACTDTYTEQGATATDNCSVGAVTIGGDVVDVNTPGVYTVTYNVTDVNGVDAAQVTRTITVQDTTAPVISLTGAAAITLEACTDTYTEQGATATDNCSVGTVTVGGDVVDATTPGVYTVTYNVTDVNGVDAAEVIRTITVQDTTAPVITLTGPAAITLEACTDTYTEQGATATDNCSVGAVTIGGDVVDVNTPGVYTVTYNVTDVNGVDAAQITRTITVQDTTAPVITLTGSAAITLEACSDSYTEQGATATDNCSVGAVTISGDVVDATTPGVYTVTYNVTDVNGVDATEVIRTITVQDTTAPVITLTGPAAITLEACSDTYTEQGATATDNCSVGAVTIGGDFVDVNTPGVYTVTYNVTDVNGVDAAEVIRTITVQDTTPPSISCPANVTVSANSGCEAIGVSLGAPTTTDNCGVASVTNNAPSSFPLGVTTVTWTVTDDAGLSTTCEQTVTVNDTTPPSTPILADVIGQCSATATVPTTTDTCAGIINGTTSDPLSYTAQGNYTINWTFNDGNGNSITVPQTVIINDTTAPNLPTLPVISGQCSATVTPPTTSDGCAGTITGTTTSPLTYNVQGTYNITWVFNDGNGNSVSAIQTVNINDNIRPTALCRNITVQLDDSSGQATITPEQINNGSTDNCSVNNLSYSLSQTTFDCTDIGPNLVVLTVQDAGGNTATCTATVTVVSPGIEGGDISGYITNTQTPADASNQFIEITACPDEPQNAILTLNNFTGNVVRWESSFNGGLNWTSVSNTTDTFNYIDIQQTTLVRAIVEIGLCQASSTIFYVIVVPPDVAPNILGPTEYDSCLGATITVEAESSYGIIPDFNEGGMFNNANPAGWDVDSTGFMPASGNNTNQMPWRETNGPRNFGGRCYDNFDGKFAIASGVGGGPFSPITTLETPVFNTIGLTSAFLEFEQAYYLNAGAYCLIELSVDGGNTYPITLDPGAAYNYAGPSNTGFVLGSTIGMTGGCRNSLGTLVDKPVSINLQDYIGLVGLRIRFTFNGNAGSAWAIDNVRIPDAPVDEIIEWTNENGVVVTTGSTTTITPVTPGVQYYGVTSLINGCRSEGDEGTNFIEVRSSLAYAGENIVSDANECGQKTVQLAAYDNQLTALQNFNNGAWNDNYVVPDLSNGDTDYPATGENGFWQVTNVVSTCTPAYSFSNLNSPTAQFTADPGIYTLTWSVADCSSSMQVTINSCDNVDFDGNNDYASFGDQYDLSGNFSLELWIKPESLSGMQTLISKRDVNNLNTGYDLRLNANILSFHWNNAGSITSSIGITTNRWYHVGIVYSGGAYTMYIDGVQIATQGGQVPQPNTFNCLLGAFGYDVTSNHYNGWIDELRFWNTAITPEQLRMMMNQEILSNGNAVRGAVVPLDVPGLNWTNLLGYYKMDSACGALIPTAGNIAGRLHNMFTSQEETAPIPYTSRIDGQNWTDNTTWTHFNVWDIPNGLGIDSTPIDWNIVRLSHDVDSGAKDITVLGLLSEVNGKRLVITDPNSVQNENNAGQGLRVTHYLELDGIIDLVGESQLIQDEGSILEVTSAGYIERDQQGTTNLYNYNYWGSPVGAINTTQNNMDYSIGSVLYDGTNSNNPLNINWTTNHNAGGTTNPITMSSRWLYAYENYPINSYADWRALGVGGTLATGLAFTMKGSGVGDPINDVQNYVFIGKPNNGTISVPITDGNQALVGNPYPSAIDALQFIRDNLPGVQGNPGSTQSIAGSLYFWEHYESNNTHILSEYEGGYGVFNLSGGLPTVVPDFISGAGNSTKTPGQYIPVGQGFFVESSGLGTEVRFKNSQRVFQKEDGTNSVFIRNHNPEEQNRNPLEIERIRFLFKSHVDGVHRPLLLGFTPNNEATDGFDFGYDAPSNDNYSSDLNFLIDNDPYVVQGVGSFNATKLYPLSLSLDQSSLVEIHIAEFENFESNPSVFIYDALLGIYTGINESKFEIQLDAGTYKDRFFVAFQGDTTLDVIDFEASELVINYLSNHEELYIRIPQTVIKKVRLYSLVGQAVQEWDKLDSYYSSSDAYRLPVEPIAEGTYIIQVETTESILSRKVIISY